MPLFSPDFAQHISLRSTFNFQLSTCLLQRATFNPQPSFCHCFSPANISPADLSSPFSETDSIQIYFFWKLGRFLFVYPAVGSARLPCPHPVSPPTSTTPLCSPPPPSRSCVSLGPREQALPCCRAVRVLSGLCWCHLPYREHSVQPDHPCSSALARFRAIHGASPVFFRLSPDHPTRPSPQTRPDPCSKAGSPHCPRCPHCI